MSYFSYGGPSQPMDSFVHEIFCVPLFEFSCIVDEQQDIIKELEKPEYQVSEDRKDTLHQLPLFQNFSANVVTAVKNVWDKCGYIDIEPYVTAMWGNSIKDNGLHAHAHSNSFFSGVWYPANVPVQDDNGGCIKFMDPLASKYHIMPRLRGSNKLNSGEIVMRPKKGMMLIFPSWLEHMVIPLTNSDKPRYSVSFNIWMTGKLGNGPALNRLEF
ncbi:hypothetical protein Sn230910_036 [Cyanophage S-RIM14]|uniref:2OG-Fe(II) oxygenase n=1 Tax=Cyanophage S-RIM14 TaxID=1278423 RepID=A0A1D7SLX7_9CAUD|nr:hypothetical protein Sn180910_036 [Cyanophage S-RIM14]AOO14666.1 hypothetical protein Sn230910_036 [Cyanophage S-RIM14]